MVKAPPCPPSFWPGYTKNNRDPPRPIFYQTGKLQCSKSNGSPFTARKAKYGWSPPSTPPFDLGTPKTIGVLLGLCSIILVSYNVLSPTVFSLARGQQNMVKGPPPSPPLPPFELYEPKSIGTLYDIISKRLYRINILSSLLLSKLSG